MKKTININFDLIVECGDDDTPGDILEKARAMMREDGLAEYINEDNAVIVDDRSFVVRTVYGRDLINKLQDIQMEDGLSPDELKDRIREALATSCGALVQRRFVTKEQANAYCAGTCDQDGWEHFESGEDYSFIPDEIWDEQNIR